MRRQIIFLIFISATFLFSCNHKVEIKQIENRVFKPETPLSYFYDSVSKFECHILSNETEQFITGNKGIIINIPRNSFENSTGETITDSIQLQISEALSVNDMLLSNLQTISENGFLRSSGMLFINALDKNGNPLRISENKSIKIEIPVKFKVPNSEIYYGEFKDSNILWNKFDNALDKEMIPLPLELLDYNYCSWECRFCEEHLIQLNNSKNENTFLATREFEERACVISTTCAGTVDYCGIDTTILNLYLSNTNLPLFKVDSLVYSYLYDRYKSDFDSTYEWNWDDKTWRNYWMESFYDFYLEKLTYVKKIDISGVNISNENSFELLVEKGYSEKEASDIIGAYKTRQLLIKQREDKKETLNLTSYAFNVNSLGWFNVDALYDNPKSQEVDFTLEVDSPSKIEYSSISMIYPRLNMTIKGFEVDSLVYKFTKDQKGYNKLPINEKAFIVAISSYNGEPYFGVKEITFKSAEKINLSISLVKSSIAEIEKRIEEIK